MDNITPKFDSFAASAHQNRIWFIDRFEAGNIYESHPDYHNIPLVIELSSAANIAALQKALDTLLAEQEILRTRLVSIDNQLVQRVYSSIDCPIEVRETVDKNNFEVTLRGILAEPFDYDVDALVRAYYQPWQQGGAAIVLVLNHAISDSPSLSILARALMAHYEAKVEGIDSEALLPDLQYVDFSEWLSEFPEDNIDAFFSHWKYQLRDKPVALEIPATYPRQAIHTYTQKYESDSIDGELAAQIEHWCNAQGCDQQSLFYSAFISVLYLYCRQEDMVVGSWFDQRELMPELAHAAGPVTNLVCLRQQLNDNMRFADVVSAAAHVLNDAKDNSALPFDKLVQMLNPDNDMSRTALFDVLFKYEAQVLPQGRVGDLRWACRELNLGFGKYDLNLLVRPSDDGWGLYLTYNLDIYSRGYALRVLSHMKNLLRAVVTEDCTLGQLNLVTDDERRQVLGEWANYPGDFDRDANIISMFETQVAKHPDRVAVSFNDEKWTYRELDEAVNRQAHWLLSQGVTPQQLIGVMLLPSLQIVATLLAVLKAGAAYLPLDPNAPRKRLAYQLEDTGVSLLLTDSGLETDDLNVSVAHLDKMAVVFAACDVVAPKIRIEPSQLAYCIYTSGSTGQPKGVLLEHRNIVRLMANNRFDFDFSEHDVWTVFHNFNFDFSVWEMYGPLLYGGQAIVVAPEDKTEPARFAKLLSERKVTVLNQTPSAFYNLEPNILAGDSHLRYVIFGGEALTPTRLQHFNRRHPNVKLINMYGITETTVHTTFIDLSQEDLARTTSNIGRPLPGVACYILDEQLRPVPPGVEGEIYVAGDGVARGYLNKPELTAERFIPNPIADIAHSVLYRSGDLGRWLDNGQIEYKGRKDNQVHIRGFRIEIGEVESALNQLEELNDAVVVVRQNRLGEPFLAAFVVLTRADISDLATTLKILLKASLPAYMIPSVFVPVDAVPRTPNGKVDGKALPELDNLASVEHVEPSTAVQKQLCEIWQQVLKLEKAPGITANFFEIGGHSLLATQIIGEINAVMGTTLPVKTLFEHNTIEELAAVIANRPGQTQAAIRQFEGDLAPLSHAQQRLWFIDQLEQDSRHYVITAAVGLDGQIEQKALQQTLDALVERHQALRTVFVEQHGIGYQQINAPSSVAIEQWMVEPGSEAELLAQAQTCIAQIATRPYDLSRDLMMRVGLIQLSQTRAVLALVVHHIVFDAVSADILIRDFCFAYQRAVTGQPIQFASLPLRFVDFAVWQRRYLEQLPEQDLAFWVERLKGAPALHSLPLDKPRPARQSYQGNHLRFTLPAELVGRLKGVALEHQATLFMTLYTTYALLLSRWSNNDDLVIATPAAGRERAEFNEIVGYFVNTLALRSQIEGKKCFAEVLAAHREVLLDALANQHVPLEYLLEVLKPERNLSYNPIFQLMFSMNNAGSEPVELSNLDISPFELSFNTTQVDLHLAVNENPGGVELVWLYATDLFDADTIHALNQSYLTLLSQIAANPQTLCDHLTLLNPHERSALVRQQLPSAEFDLNNPLDVHLHLIAKQSPQAPAVVFDDQVLSYHELDQLSSRLAMNLVALGVKPEVPVLFAVERSAEMMVGLYAIWKAGGVYVPLDPNLPQSRVDYLLNDCQAPVVLADKKAVDALDFGSASVVDLQDQVTALFADLDVGDIEPPQIERHAEDLAYILYTSGSTGVPKGVMVEHKALANRIWWMDKAYQLSTDDVVLQKTPLTFDVSLWELTWPFLKGASLVVAKPEGHKEPDYLEQLIIDRGVTTLHFVPSMLSAMLAFGKWPVSGRLRQAFCSGEALSVSQQQAFFSTGTKAKLHNLYGPTEAAIDVSYWQCIDDAGQLTVPIGKPIDNIRLYVLDAECQPVPRGVVGELHIAGVGLARGYLNLPEQTASTFISDPFIGGGKQRMYKTGDLVRMRPDGNIEYIGRRDNQVKLNGQRIELGEVESQLLSHDSVSEAVVVVANNQLVAWLVLEHEVNDLTSDLQRYLRFRLPQAMIPALFMSLDKMPVTSSGKADRKTLAAKVLPSVQQGGYTAPQGELERLLCDVWQQVLEQEQVGRHDNFFTLGGDSILSIRVIAALRAEGYAVTVADMFEHQTVAQLKSVLRRAEDNVAVTPEPFSLLSEEEKAQLPQAYSDAYPMSSLQVGMLFHSQLDEKSAIYQDVFTYHIRYTLDEELFEQAVAYIMKRHPALRTSYMLDSGRPLQCVHQELPVPLHRYDIRHFDQLAQEQYIDNWVEREKHTAFDWQQGPLFRVVLIRRSEDSFQLGLIFHHSILDGWSVATFNLELMTIYRGLIHGEVPVEPVENRLFSTFIAEELRMLHSQSGAVFWRDWLAGSEQTRLPRKANTGKGVVRGQYQLEAIAPLSNQLDALARNLGVPVQILLLIAHLKALSHATGESRIVTSVVHNSRPEVEGGMQTLGLFLNSLPLRFDLPSSSWRSLIEQLQRVNGQVLQYRNVPLASVQRASGQVYEETLFNYTHFHVQKGLNGLDGMEVMEAGGFEENNFNFVVDVKRNPDDGQITALFDYNAELFDDRMIEQIALSWVSVFEAMLVDLDANHYQTDLLASEQRQNLLDWGQGRIQDLSEVPLVYGQIRQHCEMQGDKIALVYEGTSLTYLALAEQIDAVAYSLRQRGVTKGDMLGLHLNRSIDMVVALLAAMDVGACYLPLDPAYPQDRLNYMLNDSRCRLVICDEKTHNRLNYNEGTGVTFAELKEAGAGQMAKTVALTGDDIAYVIYTSGSTGTPKGVSVSHANLRCFIYAMSDVFDDPNGIWLAITALSFDIAALELLGTLANGYSVVIAPEQGLTSVKPRVGGFLDFGLFYFGNYPNEGNQNLYRLMMEGARFADQHGFTSVWTPERHYTEFGGLFPNPAITGSALAAITENVAIRSGSVVLPINNPVKIAEDWSVIDNISNGRVGLSMASGWHANDFVFARENYEDRNTKLLEGIDEVRRLWKERKFNKINAKGVPVELTLYPKPIQSELPVWLTASGNSKTFEAAGKRGLNLLTHLLGQTHGELADKIALYRKAWTEGGHAGKGQVTLMVHTFVGENDADALDQVKEPFKQYLASSLSTIRGLQQELEVQLGEAIDTEVVLEHAFTRFAQSAALFGSVNSCIQKAEALRKLDVDELGCLIDFGVSDDDVLASLPRLALVKEAFAKPDVAALTMSVAELIELHKVTHVQCTPSFASAIINREEQRAQLVTLQHVLLGGEKLPEQLASDITKLTNATLHNVYGPTEATVWASRSEYDSKVGKVYIGKPLANYQLYVVGEHLQLLPQGATGELLIGGEGVAQGYLYRPDLTDERFVDNPFSTGKAYLTGDLVRWSPQGELEYFNRKDNQLKISGYRIELGEIETVLEQFDMVKNAVVEGVDTAGVKQLAAFIVSVEGKEADFDALRQKLASRLPYYMVPALWHSVDVMPLTPNGKIDRKALAQMGTLQDVAVIPLETEWEQRVAEVWADLLKVDLTRIGRDANFFALGGHSLLLLNLVNAIRDRFGFEVTMGEVFNRETLADLGELLAEQHEQARKQAQFKAVTATREMNEATEELLI